VEGRFNVNFQQLTFKHELLNMSVDSNLRGMDSVLHQGESEGNFVQCRLNSRSHK
jgi:hypothetical protein